MTDNETLLKVEGLRISFGDAVPVRNVSFAIPKHGRVALVGESGCGKSLTALSLWLGEPFLRRHGKWFFLKPAALDRAVELFNRYGNLATFVCRLLPAIRQLISIPAGIAKMPLGSFSFFTGLGAGIWTAILAAVGFWLGRTAGDISYSELVHRGKAFIDGNLVWVLAAVAVLVVVHVAVSKLIMKGTGAREA